MSSVTIHFDGYIASNHQVSMRTLGKTLTHLQNSFDRACIEKRRGVLWKYAKMPQSYYSDVELLVQEPKEGGYVLDFLSKNVVTKSIIDRVSQAISIAVEQSIHDGLEQAEKIEETLVKRKVQIEKGRVDPDIFESVMEHPDANVIRKYGDRAIVREIDQILAIIRSKNAGDSFFEIIFSGENSKKFDFDKERAKRFHRVVSKRSLGDPIIYTAEVVSLDRPNLNGKIKNVYTKTTCNIKFINKESLNSAIPFFEQEQRMRFIGCPYIEYGAFDPMAGDIYFIKLA